MEPRTVSNAQHHCIQNQHHRRGSKFSRNQALVPYIIVVIRKHRDYCCPEHLGCWYLLMRGGGEVPTVQGFYSVAMVYIMFTYLLAVVNFATFPTSTRYRANLPILNPIDFFPAGTIGTMSTWSSPPLLMGICLVFNSDCATAKQGTSFILIFLK